MPLTKYQTAPPIARELWQTLLDKDDRNSPAEYPDMCLITFEEFEGYLRQMLGQPRLTDETGWLVENDNDGPCWWGRTPEGEDGFGWTKNSLLALRFARKEDAEAYIEEIGWNDVEATEHMWCAPRVTAPTP